MSNSKPLNNLELKAAELIVEGHTEFQTAALCNRSRSWIQAVKRKPEFQLLVEKLKAQKQQAEDNTSQIEETFVSKVDVLHTSPVENTRRKSIHEGLSKIQEFQNRLESLGNRFLDISERMLEVYERKLELIDPADISINRLTNDLKNLSTFSETGKIYMMEVLGLEKIVSVIKSIESNSSKNN